MKQKKKITICCLDINIHIYNHNIETNLYRTPGTNEIIFDCNKNIPYITKQPT